MIYNSIIDTIGNTPMIRLNRLSKGIKGEVLVKVEYFNPGNSMKDRMAIKMVEDAEKAGILKPGGTIIEGTSGNTGMGLALAAVAKGYKCIFTMADKQSKEKIDILRAVGAEVVVCPTNVTPEDPRSYYSVARKLNRDIPNSFYPNQYDNLSNAAAHYETTGPEIWKDTEGRITHYAAGVGTGGSMCGTAKYLKEQNPDLITVGIDTYGSVFKKYKETGIFDKNEIYPYITEGIGEDFLPANVDFSVIDHFEKVTDKDAAVMTRRIPREEGIFVGNSAGSAMAGLLQMKDRFSASDVVVVIFHDHGTRYLGKMYNEDWMRDRGFIAPKPLTTALDLIAGHAQLPLLSVKPTETCEHVIGLMQKYSVSQLPVKDETNQFVGAVEDANLYAELLKNRELMNQPVSSIMGKPYPIVSHMATIEEVSSKINQQNAAVLMMDMGGNWHIITKQDVIQAISKGNSK